MSKINTKKYYLFIQYINLVKLHDAPFSLSSIPMSVQRHCCPLVLLMVIALY